MHSIEKSDLKEMGIKTLGKRIEIMAKIEELLRKRGESIVNQERSATNNNSFKKKITKSEKESWDEKIKNEYLEK